MKTGTETQMELTRTNYWADFTQLTKMRLAFSVVFSSFAGYLLAADTFDWSLLLMLLIGGFGLVGASNA